jgi:CRISPR-associated endonuclease Cas1
VADFEEDVAGWRSILVASYNNATLNPVIVVDGYGLHVGVENNHLVLTDGVGSHRRKRCFPRANRTVRRLVILGRTGSITLAALRWCCDVGVSVSIVDPDGSLTALTAAPNPYDARLRRAQALAAGTDVGLSIARTLLHAKITGHADVLRTHLDQPDAAQQLHDFAEQLAEAHDIDRLREVESHAAKAYFAVWNRQVRAQFATRERPRVPEHWTLAGPRRSVLANGTSPRKAADPVNALLNYGYALGESVTRHACQIVGLDPALGVLHTDKSHRDSMALDLLETLRPTIDTAVVQLLAERHFRRLDFTETPDGQCRLTETTTHHLATALPAWTRAVAPIVEATAHQLAEAATGHVTARTPLTRAKHIAANAPARRSAQAAPQQRKQPATCRDCGAALAESRGKLCPTCWVPERLRLATERAAKGRDSRTRVREATGRDPTQSERARGARSASLRRERAARDDWDREHHGATFDAAAFAREMLPRLAQVPLSRIVDATGLSVSAASRVRRGLLRPHPRHWDRLRQLTISVTSTPSTTRR